ncbi:MAG: hypothetical protein RL529_693 [Actinomycetota bacterium]
MHVNRSGRVARLILIVGLICFVLVGLIIRPASALTANPAAVCVGLDCTVTFGPSDEIYEWPAPAGSSKVWVQLEGSQDVVSGVHGDSVIATFKVAPIDLYLRIGDAIELRSSVSGDSLLTVAQSGTYLATLGTPDPTMMVPDQMTSTFISFVRHGGAPSGVGHAIVHYKQAAVQSPAPVATPTPTANPTTTPTASPTTTPTPTAEPQPAAVLPSPPSETPTNPPTSEPTPETPTVESVAVVAAPVVEPPRTPIVIESPVLQTPTPVPIASTTEATDKELVIPYLAVPIKPAAKSASHSKEVTSSQRVIQLFSVPMALETDEPVAETPPQIKAEPTSSAWLATSLEFAAIALSGTGVILGVQSFRRRKIAAHRKRFRLVTAFS